MTKDFKVLLVDDDPNVLRGLELMLEDDYSLISTPSGQSAIDIAESRDDIAVVVMDIKMPEMSGIEAGRKIRRMFPDIILIFHTGYPGEYSEDDIDAAEKPFEYVQKGESVSRLKRAVRNGMDVYCAKSNVGKITDYAEQNYGIIGSSEPMRAIYQIIRKAAPNNTKVMILGETGTGKELVARALHNQSLRRDKRLVIFNCNHKSPDLVESELFGHNKGAFTGAVSSRIGLFEFANGGTVFLDEIGDLDISTQAKMLRVLETGEFQTVGETPELKSTDVRILCATHHNIESLVKENRFREDLFYRLRGVVIKMPPLRERREDIPMLVNNFVDRFTIEQDRTPIRFDSSAMQTLMVYDWPGNVRQLQDTVESLIVLTDSDLILDSDVNSYLGGQREDQSDVLTADSLGEKMIEFRKNCIIEALSEAKSNVNAAARSLKVDPSNLRKWIKSYKINM